MTLKIISTEDILFQGEVTAVHLPGEMGRFTVLNNHATLIASLTSGIIAFDSEEGRGEIPVGGGIADIDNNIISVCVF